MMFDRGDGGLGKTRTRQLVEKHSKPGAYLEQLHSRDIKSRELPLRAAEFPAIAGVADVGEGELVESRIAGDIRPGKTEAAVLADHDRASIAAPQRAQMRGQSALKISVGLAQREKARRLLGTETA